MLLVTGSLFLPQPELGGWPAASSASLIARSIPFILEISIYILIMCSIFSEFNGERQVGGVYGHEGASSRRGLQQERMVRKRGLPLVSTSDGKLQRLGDAKSLMTWKEACAPLYGSCASDIAQSKNTDVLIGNTTQSLASLCGVDEARQAFTSDRDEDKVSNRIVGGKRANGDVYPYSMLLFGSDGPFCTGLVIGPSFALTAAHCIDDTTVGVKIGVENWMLDDISGRNYTTRKIKNQWSHEDYALIYSGKWNNLQPSSDIGLIQFDRPVEGIKFPKLATSDKEIPQKLRVIGFGKTEEFAFDMSKVLREVDVESVSRAKCEKALNKEIKGMYDNGMKYKITDDVICAGSLKGKKDACQGDSGGPLLVKGRTPEDDVIYGITSFGEGCARKGVPGGYTNVAKFKGWIEKKMQSQKGNN